MMVEGERQATRGGEGDGDDTFALGKAVGILALAWHWRMRYPCCLFFFLLSRLGWGVPALGIGYGFLFAWCSKAWQVFLRGGFLSSGFLMAGIDRSAAGRGADTGFEFEFVSVDGGEGREGKGTDGFHSEWPW